jgi:hypothetical protein
MDRIIVYPGSIPLDTDLLNTNRNTMVAVAALASAMLGPLPSVDGLAVAPSAAGGLAVDVAPGSLSVLTPVDGAAYGSLAANPNQAVVQTAINLASVTLPLIAPTNPGYAVTFLIQASFQEQDTDNTVLPYYNAANPTQPFLGPNNSGAAQPTLRTQRVAVTAKVGIAAPVGSNVAPLPDSGWIALATVNVGYGQSSVSGSSIAAAATTRFTPFKLPELRPGYAQSQVFTGSGQFTVPSNVTRLKVTVIGGGGAGGTHSTMSSGGGGAGGVTIGWLFNCIPGTVVPVTVGVGGQASGTPQTGSPGGTSSFGPYLAATGGQGGSGGTAAVAQPGGLGGQGYGGTVACGGADGCDSIPIATRGGDGGGPGNGRGATGLATGMPANGPGGGGGGGGSSQPYTGGAGAPGGSGASGIVIVEY